MEYQNIKEAVFLSRPNRFIAMIRIEGGEHKCHVKNTGRLGELLIPGAKIYVEEHHDPKRKTRFSLICVEKEGVLYNIDSQAPNKVAKEWVESGEPFGPVTLVKPEKTYGNSRFDLYIETEEKKIYMEVKGVTLNDNGEALFPDAPTERGKKHVLELMEAEKDGYEAAILFVVKFSGADHFTPNRKRQPELADALIRAEKAGVKIFAAECLVEKDRLVIDHQIPVILRQDSGSCGKQNI